MRHPVMLALSLVVPAVMSGAACSGDPRSTSTVEENRDTAFVATSETASGTGVRVTIRYQEGATFAEIISLDGVTLAFSHDARGQRPAHPHPLLGDHEAAVLPPSDALVPAVANLHETVLRLGAHERPDAAEGDTPLYGAAYWTARVLGIVSPPFGGASERDQPWPYPRLDAWHARMSSGRTLQDASVSVIPGAPCCGTGLIGDDCNNCVPENPDSEDDQWCAAGDHCNANKSFNLYPGGTCGDPVTAGDPHSGFHGNSTIINFFASDRSAGREFCAHENDQAKKDAWVPPDRYCRCGPDGPNTYCGADALAIAANYGCSLPADQHITATSQLSCLNNPNYPSSPPGQWVKVGDCAPGSCFLDGSHVARCTPPPPPDACAHTTANGPFCGQSTQFSFGPGDADFLYDCENDVTASKVFCPFGCHISPPGQADYCVSADPCSHAQFGGLYCGQSTQFNFGPGQLDWLYDCEAHATASKVFCPNGCFVAPPGQNDVCRSGGCSSCPPNSTCQGSACVCSGPSCGTHCCPAGNFCGPNGRCCDPNHCTAGCPC